MTAEEVRKSIDRWREENPDVVAHWSHGDEPVDGCEHCAVRPMLTEIWEVWSHCSQATADVIWSLQDGYGAPGVMPPQGYDWSGIRDSTPDAIREIHKAIHA